MQFHLGCATPGVSMAIKYCHCMTRQINARSKRARTGRQAGRDRRTAGERNTQWKLRKRLAFNLIDSTRAHRQNHSPHLREILIKSVLYRLESLGMYLPSSLRCCCCQWFGEFITREKAQKKGNGNKLQTHLPRENQKLLQRWSSLQFDIQAKYLVIAVNQKKQAKKNKVCFNHFCRQFLICCRFPNLEGEPRRASTSSVLSPPVSASAWPPAPPVLRLFASLNLNCLLGDLRSLRWFCHWFGLHF